MPIMYSKNSPIGVIDSGIGGFSVARQVQKLLPGEDLIYLGDGAHVPYGNRPEEDIVTLSRYLFRFMEGRQVKALLLACNTISCVMDRCRDEVSCPCFDIVQAGVDAVCGLEAEKVGVISSVFTHQSGCYPRRIHAQAPGREVVSRGCPNLARLVEHNLGDEAGMALVEEDLHREMDQMVLEDHIECCILGCTHYPLVADRIRKLYPDLPLVDPAEQMALDVRACLEREGLCREAGVSGRLDVFTTGDVKECARRAREAGLERLGSVAFYPPMEL